MPIQDINIFDGQIAENVLQKAIEAAESSHAYYPFHQAGDGHLGFKYSWQVYFPEAKVTEFTDQNIKALWEEVQRHLPECHSLRKCYVNAHQYGVEDSIHQDDIWFEKGITVIVYLCRAWDPNWGGATMFFSDSVISSMDIEKCVLPKYNRFVTFNKDIYHCAGLVSRKFTGLRLTCMFKVELPT